MSMKILFGNVNPCTECVVYPCLFSILFTPFGLLKTISPFLYCVKLFEEHKEIKEIYQKNFKYILVDEFQDTNFIQNKWLNLLVNKNQNICCVGDDDQSIIGPPKIFYQLHLI